MTKRVLIVDDEADIRDIVQAALEDVAGWTTVAAASGAEGLHLAQSTPLDLILLDVSMPDMNGVQLFEALQAQPAIAHIPVILLTSKVMARDRARFAALQVAGMITKPFNPLSLSHQIETLLGW